jgi:hypothetical protein
MEEAAITLSQAWMGLSRESDGKVAGLPCLVPAVRHEHSPEEDPYDIISYLVL